VEVRAEIVTGSSVLRASPPPHTARPVSRELPVDPYRYHRWGFPCCVWSPMPTCHRHYPGRLDEACSLVPLHRLRPSLCNSQVGSCNYFFGACSAFTHVMACTLAESPRDPFHRKLRQLRCLRCRFDCYRWSEPVPGRELHPLKSSAFSRRTVTTVTVWFFVRNLLKARTFCKPRTRSRSRLRSLELASLGNDHR
jgi:hypothetical protein